MSSQTEFLHILLLRTIWKEFAAREIIQQREKFYKQAITQSSHFSHCAWRSSIFPLEIFQKFHKKKRRKFPWSDTEYFGF